jgi:hypothetical protein
MIDQHTQKTRAVYAERGEIVPWRVWASGCRETSAARPPAGFASLLVSTPTDPNQRSPTSDLLPSVALLRTRDCALRVCSGSRGTQPNAKLASKLAFSFTDSITPVPVRPLRRNPHVAA